MMAAEIPATAEMTTTVEVTAAATAAAIGRGR